MGYYGVAGLGDGDKALELYHMINPINHTRTDKELMKYKVEPYIISADVYTNPKFMDTEVGLGIQVLHHGCTE